MRETPFIMATFIVWKNLAPGAEKLRDRQRLAARRPLLFTAGRAA